MPFRLSVALNSTAEPEPTYRPGDTVDGVVVFDLKDTIKAKSIRIIAEGIASTKWSESVGTKTSHGRSREISYTARHVHMQEVINAWTPFAGHAKSSICAGEHRFPFEFRIPTRVPPTFSVDDDNVNIQYSIKAVVERPWKTNRTSTAVFNVLPIKQIPESDDERICSKSKRIGFFLFRYGRIGLKIKVSRTSYIPGDTINIEACVANESSKKVVKVDYCLIRRCRCVAYRYGVMSDHHDVSRKNYEARLAASSMDVDIGARSQQDSLFFRLPVPDCTQSFDSQLICVEYFIQVRLHVKCHFMNSIKTECPIRIGTCRKMKSELIPPPPPTNLPPII